MALQLVINEEKTGWIAFHAPGLPAGRQVFRLQLETAPADLRRLGATWRCTGSARLGEAPAVAVQGEMQWQWSGLSYDLGMTWQGVTLHLAGRKTLDWQRPRATLREWLLLVYRDGEIVG
ncbi:MAG: hypothetical protein ACK4UT_02350, partial [Moraxellaceae bacterium]